MIILSIIIGLTVLITILDLSAFATNTTILNGGVEDKMLRDVNFAYVLESIGLAFPYVAALLYSNAFSTNEVKVEEVEEKTEE